MPASLIETYPAYFVFILGCALFLPLLSFLVSVIISERYSWIASVLGPFLLLLSAICSLVVFFNVWNNNAFMESVSWFTIGGRTIAAGILLNNLSALMLAVVSVVSFLVHLYSIGYMAGDDGEKRYFGMLGLFTFAMLGIVVADNLLLIFVFWELVGFSSYMLIGHWKEKPEAAAASRKAFVLNRIGDAGFLIGLMVLWANGTGFDLVSLPHVENTSLNTFAALCLFCGVIGKSAQFPLSTWLPDAMEGPTPVSALIHAATMVAAGVFLMARIEMLFTPSALLVVAVIGMITALIAALAALVQNDIKKILAYSTISQLGLMITAVGAGSWEAAILHLFSHAFFKACLFLCAGSIIHVLHQAQHQFHIHFDVQDIRNLGGLHKKLPFTFVAVLVSGSSLAGLPFFSGFVSKEAIFSVLNTWKGDDFNGKWLIFFFAFVVSFLTVLYIFRFVWKIFFGVETVTGKLPFAEPPKIMRAPVALLMALSLWLVVAFNPVGSDNHWMQVSASHSSFLAIFSIVWVLSAALVAFLLLSRNMWFHSGFLFKGLYLDQIQNYLITRPTAALANATGALDKRWIDGALHAIAYAQVTLSHLAGWWDTAIVDGSVNSVASLTRTIGSFARSFQGGKIQLYIFWALLAIIIFLIWSLI